MKAASSLGIVVALGLGLAACSSSSSSGMDAGPQLQIVTASGATPSAVAGDALALTVVVVASDGTTTKLPAGASITWTAPDPVTALAADDSTDPSPLPVFGGEPSAAWIDNPGRPDRAADLANVLFVLDPGTVQNGVVQVSATVTGSANDGKVTASIDVEPTPAGDWTRGGALYGSAGANCASCHGATGHGSPESTDGTNYTINGATYPFPAPGINAEPGNAASDPAWNAALFAVAARADMDNGGLTLRAPMPDWLATPNPATGAPLTTQDFADIYAFLKTQTN